ncbi:hypothetical protein HAZT_HAZT003392, partial [Hyalella azteca]
MSKEPAKRLKCNGVSPSSPAALSASSQNIVDAETGDEDELVDRNCAKCRECCVSYRTWLKFQSMLYVVVHDAVFDLFIMLCIVLNTVFLAVEHHGMSETLDRILDYGNRVFTAVFTLECIMKIMALSQEFFINRWNVFDLIIVLASLLDLGLEIGSGLSVLRGMRLLRVLKLAQSWRTMRVLLSIIISTLGALGNLTFVLLIIIYIFAVIGMQIFGDNYTEANFYPDPVPRWNFTDFFHSFMMIFRILCGEWVEPLWDCMRAEKSGVKTCLAIFLPALVMGNFMVLNLFLALLLNSFNSDELKSRNDDMEEESKVVELLTKMLNFFLPQRFKRKIKTEAERRAEMLAQDKADEELQAARLRELFGECKQDTTELIVDMEPETIEPVKQVKIEEKAALKEKSEPREKQQMRTSAADSKAVRDCKDRGVKQAFSEPELRIEDKENKDDCADPTRRGYQRMPGSGDGRFGKQESIELSDFAKDGTQQRRGRVLPAKPSGNRRPGGSGRDYHESRGDHRDILNRRQHMESSGNREPFDVRDSSGYRPGGANLKDWDVEKGRRDPRNLDARDLADPSGLRETRIGTDTRDFRDERDLRDEREIIGFNNCDFSARTSDIRKFDPRSRLDYFERNPLDPYDLRGLDRRPDRYGLLTRKNDSLSDLRDDRYYDSLYYRNELGRFPLHQSMRESRRDIHDRMDSQKRAYLTRSDYSKGDTTYLRRPYPSGGIPPYQGNSAGADYHHARDVSSAYHDMSNFDQQGSCDDLPEITLDKDGDDKEEKEQDGEEPTTPLGNGGPEMKSLQAKQAESTQSWGAVISYVDEITTGVKDDEDPRFMKAERKVKLPPDCFPKIVYN